MPLEKVPQLQRSLLVSSPLSTQLNIKAILLGEWKIQKRFSHINENIRWKLMLSHSNMSVPSPRCFNYGSTLCKGEGMLNVGGKRGSVSYELQDLEVQVTQDSLYKTRS